MQYLYGYAWHSSGLFPVKEITENEARDRFVTGPQVAVIAGDPMEHGVVPAYSMMMSAHAEDIGVEHYAATGSIEAILTWSTVDGRIFLTDVTEYLYLDDGRYHFQDECLASREYTFRPDGTVRVDSDVTESGQVLTEEFEGVDVSSHWHAPLVWGEFDEIGLFRGYSGRAG